MARFSLFHLLWINFLPLEFVFCSKCIMKQQQQQQQQFFSIKKMDRKSNLPSFGDGYWKCMFVDSLIEIHRSLPTIFNILCEVVGQICRCSSISFKCVSLWCLFSDLHLTKHHWSINVWLKKSYFNNACLLPNSSNSFDLAHQTSNLEAQSLAQVCVWQPCGSQKVWIVGPMFRWERLMDIVS